MSKPEKPIWFAVGCSILTTAILAGGLVLIFRASSSGLPSLATSALLLGPMALGALWGLAMAILIGGNKGSLAEAGAAGWGGMVVLFAVLLEGVNAFQNDLSQVLNVSRHTVFTGSFVVAVFAITAVSVRTLTKAAGRVQLASKAGIYAGTAACLAFLLVDLLMLSQGWELGRWKEGRSIMVTVMLAGNTGAAVTEGAVLGWILSPSGLPMQAASSDAPDEPQAA